MRLTLSVMHQPYHKIWLFQSLKKMQYITYWVLIAIASASDVFAFDLCTGRSGLKGECFATKSCSQMRGISEPGLCPGTADYQCCTFPAMPNGGFSDGPIRSKCEPSPACFCSLISAWVTSDLDSKRRWIILDSLLQCTPFGYARKEWTSLIKKAHIGEISGNDTCLYIPLQYMESFK